jgi:hypothetical protein
MGTLRVVMILLRQLLLSRVALAAENLALRQQVTVLQRSVKRPRVHRRDRIFWVWLSRLWRGWRSSLIVVQPETVLRWHREGFRLYWTGVGSPGAGAAGPSSRRRPVRSFATCPATTPLGDDAGFAQSSICSGTRSGS